MAKTTIRPQKDEMWPNIISLLVPLTQLLLVFSVSLSNILDFKKVFVYPDILILVNLLTLFSTMSLIGWFWYWRNDAFLILSPPPDGDKKQQAFSPPEKKIFNLFKYLSLGSFLLFALFIFTTILFLTKNFVIKEFWIAFFQFFSYFLFVACTGLIVYIWISEYIRKKQAFQREDFLRNLLNTLTMHGLIESPGVKIWKNQIAQGWTSRIVEIEIQKRRFIIVASFDGLEILEIYKKEDYQKLLNMPTIEQLQSQFNNLSKQFEISQKQSNEKK